VSPLLATGLPPLRPIEVDCATAVMLKILDGKCKMPRGEKAVMEGLYDAVKERRGELLDAGLHAVIGTARAGMDDELRERIYEQRLYAETMISRPVMKAFKAMLRREGVLPEKALRHD
jgi:hypothetical protein